MTNILSVVIVRNPFGYTGHLRFRDSRYDRDISAESRHEVYGHINSILKRICADELKGELACR